MDRWGRHLAVRVGTAIGLSVGAVLMPAMALGDQSSDMVPSHVASAVEGRFDLLEVGRVETVTPLSFGPVATGLLAGTGRCVLRLDPENRNEAKVEVAEGATATGCQDVADAATGASIGELRFMGSVNGVTVGSGPFEIADTDASIQILTAMDATERRLFIGATVTFSDRDVGRLPDVYEAELEFNFAYE